MAKRLIWAAVSSDLSTTTSDLHRLEFKFDSIGPQRQIRNHSRGGPRLLVEISRHKNATNPLIGFLICDVAHVAQDLRDRSPPRGSGLELDNDNRALPIPGRNVDESRGYRAFSSIVDDLQARIELFNGATQGSLQITFQTDKLTTLVYRFRHRSGVGTIACSTEIFVPCFPPKLAVPFSRIPVPDYHSSQA